MPLPHAVTDPAPTGAESVFDGRMPTAPGDLRVEARGIAPVPESHRYGGPGRLFTVWFAPNLTMTGVFTGTVGIALGLDFATALAAVVLGTLDRCRTDRVPGHLGQSDRRRAAAAGAAGVRPGRRRARRPPVAVVRRLGRPHRPVRR